MQSLFGLEGKRILVLGGGQGMGEATVRLLAALGCNVAIADRELDRAERVAAEVGKTITTLPLQVDVLDDDALAGAVTRAGRELGPLDGMATVIGMAGWSSLLDMEYEAWDADHRRNLRYFFVAAQAMARALKARAAPGSLVCVSSIDGARSAPFHASYGAAKAGLMNLVKTMAVEWSAYGIRANVVAPGAIITPRIPHMGDAEAAIFERVPLQRRGTVDEIAKAIVFLLSDMASYITGVDARRGWRPARRLPAGNEEPGHQNRGDWWGLSRHCLRSGTVYRRRRSLLSAARPLWVQWQGGMAICSGTGGKGGQRRSHAVFSPGRYDARDGVASAWRRIPYRLSRAGERVCPEVAETCQVTVVCPAYRLAPEHPFPAALRDGWAVLASLWNDARGPVIISGDSAGGGLAAGLAQCAAAAGISLCGLMLLSAWLDLTVTSQCYELNAQTDPLFSYASAQDAAALYLQGHSPQDPLASPLFANALDFPPSFISAGAGEVLADDAVRFHECLCRSGILSTLCLLPDMEHVAVTRSRTLSGAEETFMAICAFLSSRLEHCGSC